MVDLSSKGVSSDIDSKGPGFKELVSVMESREAWTLDRDSAFKRSIINWAQDYDAGEIAESGDSDVDRLVKILAFLSSSRALTLLAELEREAPGFTVKCIIRSNQVITESPDTDVRHFKVFRDRMITLYQANFIKSLFAPERIEGIRNAIAQ